MSVRISVLASGRGSNFVALAEAQNRGELGPAEIVALVCNQSKAGALEHAQKLGIEGIIIPHRAYESREQFEQAMVEALQKRNVEWVVLAGFMRVLTPTFLDAFPERVINLHPALLPSFPGADGIGDALAYGAKITGVTVHFVDSGVDTGPIILQEPVQIHEDDTYKSLASRIHEIEHRLLPKAVRLAASGKTRINGRIVHILSEDPETKSS